MIKRLYRVTEELNRQMVDDIKRIQTIRIVECYEIGECCYGTDTYHGHLCKHYIKYIGWNPFHQKINGRYFGREIYKILKKDGITDEHFEQYKEYIRRTEHPTEEEKKEDKERHELEIIEYKEAEQLLYQIEQSSCSTHIERIKQRILKEN
jgi:hypothetical protein